MCRFSRTAYHWPGRPNMDNNTLAGGECETEDGQSLVWTGIFTYGLTWLTAISYHYGSRA